MMRHWFGMRSYVRTIQVAVVAVAVVVMAGPAGAETVNKFSASIAPTTATVGTTASYTFTVQNSIESAQKLGSAEITVPAGFAATLGPLVVSSGKQWTGSVVSGVIRLRAIDDGYALNPGESLSLSLSIATSCSATDGTWTTVARQSTVFNGPGFILVGAQPVLTVSGTCGGGGGGGGGAVCTAGPCTAVDDAGTTSVTAQVPAGATLTIGFDNESSDCVSDLIGSSVSLVPGGTWTATQVIFEWDKSIAPGNGVANFKLCWSKPDQAAAELPKCGKKNPIPTCELSRSRNGAGDLQISVLLGEDPDFELG